MLMLVFLLVYNLLGESEQKRAKLYTMQNEKLPYCESSSTVINYLYNRDLETMGLIWHR